MSVNHTESEIRPLSADEIDAVAGGDIHIHVKGVFHLAVGEHGGSIGVFGFGVGVDDTDGVFTFTFD
jgi:hypothetical protein